jgi:hypothetical protein
MADFMRISLKIQRNIKNFLVIKKAKIDLICLKFSKIIEKNSFFRSASIKSANFKKPSTIPKQFILEYATKYYNFKINQFIQSKLDYVADEEAAEQEYQDQLLDNFFDIFLRDRKVKIEKRLIKKPVLLLYSDRKTILKFINKGKKQWMNLMTYEVQQRTKLVRFNTNLF